MKIHTKVFGEIEIDEAKIITFKNGIIGFPELKKFALLHDEERGTGMANPGSSRDWRKRMPAPVMNPLDVKPDYDPEVDDELLASAGNLTPENLLVLVTVSVPSDLKKMSVNLQGPFVINIDECKGCQIILDNGSYPVKFPIYDILQAGKAGA